MKKIYFVIVVLSIGLLVLYTAQPSSKIQEELQSKGTGFQRSQNQ